jgi:hypothetical protein
VRVGVPEVRIELRTRLQLRSVVILTTLPHMFELFMQLHESEVKWKRLPDSGQCKVS